MLLYTIEHGEGSEQRKEHWSKRTPVQKTQIHQDVFAPEALFTLYNSTNAKMKHTCKNVTMSGLMAKARIASVLEIMKEWEYEYKQRLM